MSAVGYQCSGGITSVGSVLGVSYDGTLDDYGTYYVYGGRSKGGYHAFCKGKFDLGPPLSRTVYYAGSVWLHGDGSTETKQHNV
jgi:hypothetical protein